MKRNKHFIVSGRFYLDFEKMVVARTEAEAIRKARDSILKTRKLKKSHFARDEAHIVGEY